MVTIGTVITFVAILKITSSAATVLENGVRNFVLAAGHSEGNALQVHTSTVLKC